MGWLGLISYGLFLWHSTIMLDLNDHGAQTWLPFGFPSLLLATLAITIPIATASYYLIEKPALRFKDPRNRRPAPRADRADSAPAGVARHAEP
jgi:peptidoglycan/LPS O-acetylase OafA/YrhL